MNRRHAVSERQQSLPALAACVFGTTRRVCHEQLSKPESPGRRV
jgi:hypothetical protein